MPQARMPEDSDGYFIRCISDGRLYGDYTVSGATVTLTEEMLPTPTKDGYLFAGWYTTQTFDSGTKVEVGQTLNLEAGYLYLYAKWITGIPAQIQRITNAVEDIKSAITEKGGTVPEDATIDDLAGIIRGLSTGGNVYVGATDPAELGDALNTGDIYIYVPKLN